MRFTIRFKIGNRLGAGSRYSLRDFCISVVDRYALNDAELTKIVSLKVGEWFTNEDMEVRRAS